MQDFKVVEVSVYLYLFKEVRTKKLTPLHEICV
jgi:hypothetical protein